MTKEWKKQFFEALAKKMEQFTKDNMLVKNQANGEWVMKTVFATAPEREHFVVVQGLTYPAREDVLLLELYIKLTDEVKAEALPQLRLAIDELNTFLPVGLLGISPADGHMYLRDCFKLLTNAAMEEAVRDAVVNYELLMEVVVAAYPGLRQIWSGAMTFEETVAKHYLKCYSKQQGGD